jgi:glycine oxidase
MELKRRGASVAVLDRGEPGHESSSAAAGMLVIDDPERSAILTPLAVESAGIYGQFVADLELRSKMKVGFESRGALYIANEGEHFAGSPLSAAEVRDLEPSLAEHPRVYFLKEQSVDPRLLVQAAVISAMQLGVIVHHESRVENVKLTKEHQLEVHTARGQRTTATFVNCAGAWAATISGCAVPAKPMKGQMLSVVSQKCKLQHVVRSKDVYLMPRWDGRIVIGATVEDAGFDKTVKPDAIQRLHQLSANLVPAIGEARILEAWAGLRPGSPDDLPIMGAGLIPGTYSSTGHFRNGILLAPISAVVMADVIEGKRPGIDITPFSPARFRRAPEALVG